MAQAIATAIKPVWIDLASTDSTKSQEFYGKLFGWKIDASNPMKYGMVEAVQGQGIPGGVGQLGDKPYPKVTFYVSTSAIERSLKQASELGGKVLMPRTELPGGPVLGMFADPEGNAIGLVEEADA